ncbi:MAG TPA: DUF4214 domain-containing protein [Pirellulales bacterium]
MPAIDQYYSDFLVRAASAADQQFWLPQLQSGALTADALAELLLASDEFFAEQASGAL